MFGDWWVGLNADFAQSHISTLKSKDILFQFRSSSPLLKSKTRDLVANKYSSISTFIEYVPICSKYLNGFLVTSGQFYLIRFMSFNAILATNWNFLVPAIPQNFLRAKNWNKQLVEWNSFLGVATRHFPAAIGHIWSQIRDIWCNFLIIMIFGGKNNSKSVLKNIKRFKIESVQPSRFWDKILTGVFAKILAEFVASIYSF